MELQAIFFAMLQLFYKNGKIFSKMLDERG